MIAITKEYSFINRRRRTYKVLSHRPCYTKRGRGLIAYTFELNRYVNINNICISCRKETPEEIISKAKFIAESL